MNKTPVPFGVMILLRAAQEALLKPDSIKSKVLGNALAVAQSDRFPAEVDLTRYEHYRHLTDAQKKIMMAEIERSKYPNYDQSKSLAEFIAVNWNSEKKFEKRDSPRAGKAVSKTTGNSARRANIKSNTNVNNTNVKGNVKNNAHKAAPTLEKVAVVYKTRKI